MGSPSAPIGTQQRSIFMCDFNGLRSIWGESRLGAETQPIRAAVTDLDLLKRVEVAQQPFPFEGQAILAREIIEMLLHRQRQEGAEDMAANAGVG